MPRGKQKPHDEFKDWTVHVLVWIRSHWVSVVELLAVGAVAFAVVVGADAYGRHSARAGAEAFFAAGSLPEASADKKAAIEEIADDYSRYFAGKRAMMELGDMLLTEGKDAEAAGEFRKLANGSRNQPMLRVAALHKLAEAQLSGGDAEAAAATYRKAAADPGNLISLTSEVLAAACLERAGDFERAAELYRMIIEDAGEDDRLVRDLSEERLLWLAAKGHISG